MIKTGNAVARREDFDLIAHSIERLILWQFLEIGQRDCNMGGMGEFGRGNSRRLKSVN